MTRDLNKDIGSSTTDGIIYNHLNLPWQIQVRSATGTKGTITYIYDAAGNKLEKRTMDSVGNVQTHTAYIGSFQYQGRNTYTGSNPADTLQFFGDEEGRVRVVTDTTTGQPLTSFKYDYFIKDHLGNTRMVLTDEQESDKYIAATMEVADSAQENLYYCNLSNTRADLPAAYPTDTTTNPNNKVAHLGGATGPKVGPGITLKVMAGDEFSIKVSSWYRLNGSTPGAPANPLSDLLASLISGVGNLPGGGHPSISTLQTNSAPLSSNITEFLSDTGSSINSSRPHAFVNWVLFDNQFNYVAESSGFDQVGSDTTLKKHVLMNLPVTKSGYLYIYLSNETENVDVFFDNLQVTHTRGPLTEEDHYYPFGLTMAGISDKALKSQYAENKYRLQKQELQNKEFSDGSGLEMYEFKYRIDDPQIGRFASIDPLANKYVYNSTYSFSENKVTNSIELEGLESVDLSSSLWRAAGISSSTDPKEFVKNVGKELLKPKTWAEGYALTGGLVGGPILLGIFTDGLGSGTLFVAEARGFVSMEETPTLESLSLRANEIHSTLPSDTQNFNTTAVASATSSDGNRVTLVASNEKNLRPAQMAALKPGEIAVSGSGHAETTIIDYADANRMKVDAVAASRPICNSCAVELMRANAVPASPLKHPDLFPNFDFSRPIQPKKVKVPYK
jgi:hypothetical protein